MEANKEQTPWVLTVEPDLSLYVCLDDEDHTIVASISTSTKDGYLIAASKELLEVAKKTESVLLASGYQPVKDSRHPLEHLLWMTQEAIAKAEIATQGE